jgi:hypothetical protein
MAIRPSVHQPKGPPGDAPKGQNGADKAILFLSVDKSALSAPEVLRRLHVKFSANFEQAIACCAPELERVDIRARALAECGVELSKTPGLTSSQLQLSKATEEVFADLVASLYVASIGLEDPRKWSCAGRSNSV